jgi:transposase-like protein
MASEPKTLQQAIVYFADPQNCIDYLVARRWANGVVCPTCGSTKVHYQPKHRRWQCATKHSKRQFTVKVGTIFEDSPITLDKWLTATWMITNCKNGNSSWELHRTLGVTQKTAWFMGHRIRLAMQDELTGGTLSGEIEVDETFIGGKVRNMHKDRKAIVQTRGRNMGNKSIVVGVLERGGKVHAGVVPDRGKASIQDIVKGVVEPGSQLYSDEHGQVWQMDEYEHQMVNHLEQYVNGNVHTNGMENFWSLLKRSIGGTYVSVEPFHLFRYVDEQAFRFNNRGPMDDAQRFSYVIRKIVGKRLTYAELIGKTDPATRTQRDEEEIHPF